MVNGAGSKVSVEQVQGTFGKFPRANTLSVGEVRLFPFLSFFFFFFFLPFLEELVVSLAIHQLK